MISILGAIVGYILEGCLGLAVMVFLVYVLDRLTRKHHRP